MKFDFPIIRHIDDVLPAVDPNFFIVADRGDHTVISYQFSCTETFPDVIDNITALRREFRGIIFDKDGKIIRRPLHKFFNVNERSDTLIEKIDVSKNHIILDKLDGSMIAPYIVNSGFAGERMIWGTKMGDTDVVGPVNEFIAEHINYVAFATELIYAGYTPIFEWCSRKQRIVLDYGKDQLILTAIRHMHSGEYLPYYSLGLWAKKHNITLVNKVYGEHFNEHFLNSVKNMEDVEGFVIRFDTGHAVKIKCDWYCKLHRIKSDIAYERGVVSLCLEEKMDDLKSLMDRDDKERIRKYETAFWNAFTDSVTEVRGVLYSVHIDGIDRKTFALEHAPKLEGWLKAIVFRMWGAEGNLSDDTDKIIVLLKETILKNCGRNNKFAEFRKTSIFKDVPVWQEMFMGDSE